MFSTAPDRRGLGSSPAAGVGIPAAVHVRVVRGSRCQPRADRTRVRVRTNATFTWPKASFDDNYDNAADPVLAYDPKPAETMTALVAAQQPVFHLVNGDACSADPSGTGLPVDNTTASGSHGGSPAGMHAYNPYVGDVYLDQIEASASTIPWMISMGVAVAATAAAAVLLVGVGAFINHLGQAARTGAATDDVTDDVTDD